MLIFNTAEIGNIPPDSIFVFPTTLPTSTVPLWCVAMTNDIQATAPFRGDPCFDHYNVIGLFPCIDLAVTFAYLLEQGGLDGVDMEGLTYANTVH